VAYGYLPGSTSQTSDVAEIQELLRESYRLIALKRMLAALNDPGKPQEPTEGRPPRRRRGSRHA
jgi:hypothetical protein